MNLKAYVVHDGDAGENACLVFAESNAQARQVGFGFNDLGCDYGYFSMRAYRCPEADKLLVHADIPAPYIETRGDILRNELNWRWDDGNGEY